ncbi:hypothetical protein GGI01_003190 [Coemansia sp. RSA 376]|nr:hypothetical protein LPJ71_000446 [Coemansia sp. S17]KAJ2016659.1 hypothetical protein GGI14_003484 [Coemansia sp. S680]KAJ2040567.1 hypothetical protein H4S03_000939 [Coemansia sp. S3946]KAJ2053312.1 hypothetical protein H4S04_000751 [Coemansia sp. S16]KAJ2066761.1 hypothetical protein GGI08_001709 [Coemansia sp. S2]KAJ2072438.1 hypothetical protein GGH13_002686 [Coemansia sp. S155-1]KAJ2249453.1 hypothetical protein GGI13_004281 [Coemansia sp. RSA 455]KAJ2260136.1 hypothetical protein G
MSTINTGDNDSNTAVVAPPPQASATATTSQKQQEKKFTGAFERRLDGQLDALQSMLSSLAAKVEAIEEDTEVGQLQQNQQQQGAVADAYKDMVQVEHAVGQLEPRLDLLLSKLDSLLEGNDDE